MMVKVEDIFQDEKDCIVAKAIWDRLPLGNCLTLKVLVSFAAREFCLTETPDGRVTSRECLADAWTEYCLQNRIMDRMINAGIAEVVESRVEPHYKYPSDPQRFNWTLYCYLGN